MKINTKLLAATCSAVAIALPTVAHATNGYFAHGWGIQGKSMGGVGIALPQDSLAAATNPAGMARVGNRIDFGLDIFSPDRSMTISGNTNPGFNETLDGNGDDNFLVPSFGYNRTLNNKMTFGVSVYGNGGMNTNYEQGIARFSSTGTGQGKTGVNLSQLFVAPTYTYKLNEDHSVGVSLNLAYQEFEAYGITAFDTPTFSVNDGYVTDNGTDTSTGWGLTLGWIGKISPTVSIGAMYRSETKMSEFDDYKGLFAENGDFDIPSMYGIGIGYTPTDKLKVGFDVARINYTDVPAVSNSGDNFFSGCLGGDSTQCLGGSDGAGFGWEDITVYKLGVSYMVNKSFMLRGGWNHGEQPIPASETFFNILAPGVVEDHVTLGATWFLQNGGELTVAYMHAFENEVKGSNSIPPAFLGGEADLKMSQDSIGIAYGWNF